MNHKVFLAQFDAIKKLASEGPCVMVGRCADYALAEYKDCFVFLYMQIQTGESAVFLRNTTKRQKKQKI